MRLMFTFTRSLYERTVEWNEGRQVYIGVCQEVSVYAVSSVRVLGCPASHSTLPSESLFT